MGRRSGLSVEERTEAVLSLLRREEPAARIARRFGVSEQSLYRWRDQFLDGGRAGLGASNGRRDPRDEKIAQLERDVAERDRVVGELTIVNRVLKKTSGESP
jgi:transposase